MDLNKGYNGLSYQVSVNVSPPFCVTYSVVINAGSDLPKKACLDLLRHRERLCFADLGVCSVICIINVVALNYVFMYYIT